MGTGGTMETKITRLYTGPDSKSHFEDINVPIDQLNRVGNHHSKVMKATGIYFSVSNPDFYIDWHNAPGRRLIITLEGKNELEASDGTKRQFGPGDIILAEDTTGQGHISRTLGHKPRKILFITLD